MPIGRDHGSLYGRSSYTSICAHVALQALLSTVQCHHVPSSVVKLSIAFQTEGPRLGNPTQAIQTPCNA